LIWFVLNLAYSCIKLPRKSMLDHKRGGATKRLAANRWHLLTYIGNFINMHCVGVEM
jgi:hypothetical protein